MKNYLMLPMALMVAVSIAACSNTGTDAPEPDFAAAPPPTNTVPMEAPIGPGPDPMGAPPASGF